MNFKGSSIILIILAAIGPASLFADGSSGSRQSSLRLCGCIEPRVRMEVEEMTTETTEAGQKPKSVGVLLKSRGTMRGGYRLQVVSQGLRVEKDVGRKDARIHLPFPQEDKSDLYTVTIWAK
ncbi:MAG: hypothetical protein K9L57_01805 [Spirochaetaceae bacterium]|nr:hypothetical protein [Spirochaetaceae bacterium]